MTGARGFTLVEMLVVLAIISVVTVIAVLGQSQFNNSILLSDTTYTVALSIREAQSLGISSRTFSAFNNTGYGVHFTSGQSASYLIFADTNPAAPGSTLGGLCLGHTAPATDPDSKPGDCLYTASSDGLVQSFKFSRGFTISNVCGHTDATHTKCLGTDFDTVDISFLRPNTETSVIGTRAGNTGLTDACIHIKAPIPAPASSNIYVSKAGEIAVLQTCPGSGWPAF